MYTIDSVHEWQQSLRSSARLSHTLHSCNKITGERLQEKAEGLQFKYGLFINFFQQNSWQSMSLSWAEGISLMW